MQRTQKKVKKNKQSKLINKKKEISFKKMILKMNLIINSALLLLVLGVQGQTEVNDTTDDIEVYKKSEVLSRRKRFIIFPEGSSLQLGKFENQNKQYLRLVLKSCKCEIFDITLMFEKY